MPDGTTERPDMLLLIEDAIEPLKMIVTWPKVRFDYAEQMEGIDLTVLEPDQDFAIEWGRVAGVDPDFIAQWSPVLFENGILRAEGDVSDVAKLYCQKRGLLILSSVGSFT